MLIVLFLVSHFNFLFVPCGGLSWLPVNFLLHVKYTLSYRIVCVRICSSSGVLLPCVKEMKYLGVTIVSFRSFKIYRENLDVLFIALMPYLAATAELLQQKLCCNCCVVNSDFVIWPRH